MTEQQVLYQLVEDVGGLKSDVENLAKGQSEQWSKINEVKDLLGQCDRKLDTVIGQEKRIDSLEATAEDYCRTKTRAVAFVSGIGVAVGGTAGAIGAWFAKWFNSGG